MFHIHTAKQMDNNVTALNLFQYSLVFWGVFFFFKFPFLGKYFCCKSVLNEPLKIEFKLQTQGILVSISGFFLFDIT